jgi:hypothetical protein
VDNASIHTSEAFQEAIPTWEKQGLSVFYLPDFSVVLFRSDFVLVSEKNHMKVHKNQWIGTMSYPPERLSGVTSRGQTMVPGGAEAFAVT